MFVLAEVRALQVWRGCSTTRVRQRAAAGPFWVSPDRVWNPHLAVVAAVSLRALRALRQPAGGGVAARVGALLHGSHKIQEVENVRLSTHFLRLVSSPFD